MSESKEIGQAQSDDAQMMKVLQASLYPGAKLESVRLVMAYCRAQRLDPFSKPVHLVPMRQKEGSDWVTRDVIMPGINLYRIRAERTGHFLGSSEPEFGPIVSTKLGGHDVKYPEWCRVTVSKLVAARETQWTAIEYWLENYQTAGKDTRAPNAMWQKRPFGQLAKCAEAQALRKAFPDAVGAEPTFEERGYVDPESIVLTQEPLLNEPSEVVPIEAPKNRSEQALLRARKPQPKPTGVRVEPSGQSPEYMGGDAPEPIAEQPPEPKTPPKPAQAPVAGIGFDGLGGDDPLEMIAATAELEEASLERLNEIGFAWGIPTMSVSGDDEVETDLARSVMLEEIKIAYERKVLPAMSMWAADLEGRFELASTSEREALVKEAKQIAPALRAVGLDAEVAKLNAANAKAKERLASEH